jgi:hypothetical protein
MGGPPSDCLLEDADVVGRFRHEPHGFLDAVKPPIILDESRNVPEVFNYVRARIDRAPRRTGQWFLGEVAVSGRALRGLLGG